MVRLVLRLSTLAKCGAAAAAIGVAFAAYGRLQDEHWANVAGSILLFGGAIVYFIERMRMILRARRVPPSSPARDP